MIVADTLTDERVARRFRALEQQGSESDDFFGMFSEACFRAGVPLEHSELGLTDEGSAILDAWLGRVAPPFDWLSNADENVARCGGRTAVEHAIAALDWEYFQHGTITLGAMPGMAINQAIRELGIPKVTAVCVGGIEVPEDEFYPGLYGIEGNYADGRAHIFLIDTGVELTPCASVLYPS